MVWYILIFNLTSVTVCSVGPAVCSGPSDFSHLGPKIELLSPVPILQCNQLRRRTTTTMYYRGQFANHIIALCTMPWSSVCQAADSR